MRSGCDGLYESAGHVVGVMLLGKVDRVHVTELSAERATVAFGPVVGAVRYKIEMSVDEWKTRHVVSENVHDHMIELEGMHAGVMCDVRVYAGSEEYFCAEYGSVSVMSLSIPNTLDVLDMSRGCVSLGWSGVQGATSYVVEQSVYGTTTPAVAT